MSNASPLLYPSPDSEPTLVWRSRVLPIPYTPNPGSGRPTPRPFAFEPVIEMCVEGRLAYGQTATNWTDQRWQGLITSTASVLEVNRNRIYRWLESGLTAEQADVIAIMFGLHPCLIWSDWFSHAPDEKAIKAAKAKRPRRLNDAHDRPPRSVDAVVRRRRKQGATWKQVAAELQTRGVANWRTGRPWRVEQLESAYESAEMTLEGAMA
jgi:hypothetical protein